MTSSASSPRAATDHIIAHHPDVLLVTTGYGLNGWFDSARERGLEEQPRQALAGATILVRGAKGRGAVRGLGFEDAGMAAQERMSALVDAGALVKELTAAPAASR